MKYILVFFGLLAGCQLSGQDSDWRTATQWTIYNVQSDHVWKLPLDSLDRYVHQPLSNDTMSLYLSGAKAFSPHGVVWMGVYITSCMLDNKKRKIDISTYGGFFYDESRRTYYQIPVERQKGLYDFLGNLPGVQTAN
jgi:hypothetical protein